MSKQGPTPWAETIGTPWEACKGGECQCGYLFGFGGQVYIGQIIGPKNVDDSGCPDPHLTRESQKAAIKAVIRAVNSHADLLEALKQIADFTDDAPDDDPFSHVYGVARAAIAKAEAND